MWRLVLVCSDVRHAQRVVQHLKEDGIPEKHIYAIGRSDLPMEELPDAGPEHDDFLPAFERGVALGGVGGIFAGVLALAFPPAGVVVGGGGILLIGLMGASLGGLLTGMAGSAFPSSRLKSFEDDVRAGRVLVLADVPLQRADEVNDRIRSLEPETRIEGFEPPAPLIPPR